MFAFFFFNDTATTEIYTLSLHDALPISQHELEQGDLARGQVDLELSPEGAARGRIQAQIAGAQDRRALVRAAAQDRKSTRLNSSHANISYAVFCLKKKNTTHNTGHVYWS